MSISGLPSPAKTRIDSGFHKQPEAAAVLQHAMIAQQKLAPTLRNNSNVARLGTHEGFEGEKSIK